MSGRPTSHADDGRPGGPGISVRPEGDRPVAASAPYFVTTMLFTAEVLFVGSGSFGTLTSACQ